MPAVFTLLETNLQNFSTLETLEDIIACKKLVINANLIYLG